MTAMIMVPAFVIFKMMFIIGAGATAPPPGMPPPPPSIERETAYQRQMRMAHEAQLKRMNPIQKALYLLKNPGAKPPPDPLPPPKKPIPVLCYIAYGASIIFNLF